MTHIRKTHVLHFLIFVLGLGGIQAFGQPNLPPDRQFRVPDISTIPGAVTIKAEEFNLEGTNFALTKNQMLRVKAKQAESASLSLIPRVPGGSYTFIVDAVLEKEGQATFSLQVGDKKLEAKQVPLVDPARKDKKMEKLMWTEVEIAVGTKITVEAQIDKKGDTVTAAGRWTRLIIIPHNRQPNFIMPPAINPPSGGPRGVSAPEGAKKDSEKAD